MKNFLESMSERSWLTLSGGLIGITAPTLAALKDARASVICVDITNKLHHPFCQGGPLLPLPISVAFVIVGVAGILLSLVAIILKATR